MAVRAAGSVTVASINDVASTVRWYLLQASTLTAPAKPTASPPSGSWVATEPTYTEDSTNSLYTCDETTFSDGTWAYSSVSLSSSYEAAKAAYNKAVAVTSSIDQTATSIKADVSKTYQPKSDMNSYVTSTSLTETVNGLGIDALQTTVNSNREVVEKVGQHFMFGDTGLTITNAKDDPTAVSMQLDNDSLEFMARGMPVLELDGSNSTAKASKFQVGKYCWTSTGNGENMSLLYVGDA